MQYNRPTQNTKLDMKKNEFYIHNMQTYLMSLWLVSMCTKYFEKGTEYVLLTTHPNLVILASTPTLSTRCIDEYTRPHCTLCPCASRAPRTIVYPASGIVLFIAVINTSNSSSLQLLYEDEINILFSAIRLNSVALETPRSLEMHFDGSPSSTRCVRVSNDTVNRGRPRPEHLCNSRVESVHSLSPPG